jgi:hypothetical protein
MATQQITLFIINAIGGGAVIGSYILGFRNSPSGGDALWGGAPSWLRPIYTASMVLSALGYFAFLYFLLFRLAPEDVQIANRFGFSLFHVIFLGILVPSALWMPLTSAWIANPSAATWIGVRTVLFLVGLSSCVLVWALLSLKPPESGFLFWLAVAGSAYFAFHAAILDMLLWPVLFHLQS